MGSTRPISILPFFSGSRYDVGAMQRSMRILGIESSCDETAASVVEAVVRNSKIVQLAALSNVVASQVKIHAKTGGVVPEVAARQHVEAIIPVVQQALREAEPRKEKREQSRMIDAIAVTRGPGLITSLRVGVDTARTLASVWKKPLVAVNHLEGHIYANWLATSKPIQFPVLALIVSGGHTELVLMRRHLDYRIIGATRDDAAGEAFDKVAKILRLGYPGGPAVSKCAARGNPQAVAFPRPMIDSQDFDFSFAGLKTAVLYYCRDFKPQTSHLKPDVCASFEQAVVDVLVAKTIRAAKKYKVKTVLVGGGVAANRRLRDELGRAVRDTLPTTYYLLPAAEYTGDNAAMIAAAGAFRAAAKDFTLWQEIEADPNLSL